ncbi:MAG: hypothetical protein JO061_08135 [Acidobacteriaceae bacterium]|nr:hypothetical protein [Acidobacteriaceae bacterium]
MAPSEPLEEAPFENTRSSFRFNGIHYVSWWHDEYANSGAADESMNALAATHANWAGILVTWYQADIAATVIYPDAQKTPTDEAVTYAIRQLQSRGLKILLKLHVDGADGSWRGQFNPPDADAWFQSYSDFILYYARLAQSLGVEGIVIGTEYVMLSGAQNQAHWQALIGDIRSAFSGILTYAANATHTGDEFTQVSFWDKLDLIGIDGYFPLTKFGDPSVAQLAAAWSRNLNGSNLVEVIQNLSSAFNKPVIFTEIGYRSITGTNTRPWDAALTGVYDPAAQANCYQAFFEVWSNFSAWMQGAFWWDWPVAGPLSMDTGYSPRGKPAGEVVTNWYGT